MDAYGTRWNPFGDIMEPLVESAQKVADPRRTVLDSIETCTSFCKLREPFWTFLDPLQNLPETFSSIQNPERSLQNF